MLYRMWWKWRNFNYRACSFSEDARRVIVVELYVLDYEFELRVE